MTTAAVAGAAPQPLNGNTAADAAEAAAAKTTKMELCETSDQVLLPIDDPNYVSSLPSPLKEYASAAVPPAPLNKDDGGGASADASGLATPASRIDGLEIDLRSRVLTLTNDALLEEETTEKKNSQRKDGHGGAAAATAAATAINDLLHHLSHSLDLCLHILHFARQKPAPSPSYESMDHPVLKKIPFLLLEDAFDALPLHLCKSLWNELSSTAIDRLCDPTLLFTSGSKFVWIRICNKLLRKLSNRDRDAVFAGTIMTTLAKVFPLSERSAVNVLGTFNVTNVTRYETLQEFETHRRVALEREVEEEAEDGDNIEGAVAELLAGGVGGGGAAGAGADGTGGIGGGNRLEYDFYETFWGVQRIFTDPTPLIPPSSGGGVGGGAKGKGGAKKGGGGGGAGDDQIVTAMQNLDGFVDDVRTVMAAFEGNPFDDAAARQSRNRWLAARRRPIATATPTDDENDTDEDDADVMDVDRSPDAPTSGGRTPRSASKKAKKNRSTSTNGGGATSSSSVRNHTYLTNSQLLHLQLRDPEIRSHFLTQLLIVSSYLTSSVESVVGGGGGTTAKSASAACAAALTRLSALSKRAEDSLRRTPPNGARHLRTLQWLLDERESAWARWKDRKCHPPLEKFAESSDGGGAASSSAKLPSSPVTKKRKTMGGGGGSEEGMAAKRRRLDSPLGGGGPSGAGAAAVPSDDPYSYDIDVKRDLPAISRNMAGVVPDLSEYLEEYVEALDPEAGIEEEYHPRNDKTFAWRALRLLARDHLGSFGKVRRSDGDFEGLVRTVWREEKGVEIPGGVACEDENTGEEEEEEEAAAAPVPMDEDGGGDREEKHEGLDDISVGDASVGSPTSADFDGEPNDQGVVGKTDDGKEASAKKEKLAEFAKAALEEEDEMLEKDDGEEEKSGGNVEDGRDGSRDKKEAAVTSKRESVSHQSGKQHEDSTRRTAAESSDSGKASSSTQSVSQDKLVSERKRNKAPAAREKAAKKPAETEVVSKDRKRSVSPKPTGDKQRGADKEESTRRKEGTGKPSSSAENVSFTDRREASTGGKTVEKKDGANQMKSSQRSTDKEEATRKKEGPSVGRSASSERRRRDKDTDKRRDQPGRSRGGDASDRASSERDSSSRGSSRGRRDDRSRRSNSGDRGAGSDGKGRSGEGRNTGAGGRSHGEERQQNPSEKFRGKGHDRSNSPRRDDRGGGRFGGKRGGWEGSDRGGGGNRGPRGRMDGSGGEERDAGGNRGDRGGGGNRGPRGRMDKPGGDERGAAGGDRGDRGGDGGRGPRGRVDRSGGDGRGAGGDRGDGGGGRDFGGRRRGRR